MATPLIDCPRCGGTGAHRVRPYCLCCDGAGKVTPERAASIREYLADPHAFSRKVGAGMRSRAREYWARRAQSAR